MCRSGLTRRAPPHLPSEVNATSNAGWTALHAAAFHGHAKCCSLLIAADARRCSRSMRASTQRTRRCWMCCPAPAAVLPGTCCDTCGTTSGADGRSVKICDGCYAARFFDAACATAATLADTQDRVMPAEGGWAEGGYSRCLLT